MKNADGEEHSRRADKSGQCYKAAVITLTSMSGSVGKKAVATMILAANMKATRAESRLHMFVPTRTQGDYNHQYDGKWMLVLVVILVLTVRGAVALVRDVQSCFGRREEGVDTRRCQQEPLLSATPTPQQERRRHEGAACESSPGDARGQTEGPSSAGAGPPPMPPPQPAGQAGCVVIVPPKIMVTKTAGLKCHATTCSEVAPERRRIIGTYTPCSKCEAVLKVPIGVDRNHG